LPLSVKTRLGSKNKDEIFTFAKRMENAGVRAIAVHGRTLNQGFKGSSDWEPIYKLKEQTKMYVLGNGDIQSRDMIKARLENLDGVLIGRGALGNPFIFKSLDRIEPKEILSVALRQAIMAEKNKGKRGLIEMRKHLAWYVKGLPNARSLRQKLVKIENIKDIKDIIKSEVGHYDS
jgi:tRNA-dihydrouridine synthase